MTGVRRSFAEVLGIRQSDDERDSIRLELTAGDDHVNPGGFVHGGVIATLIDVAMGRVVAVPEDDEQPVTIEMKVNYMAPGEPGELVAVARVRRRGDSFTVVEAEVMQGDTVLAIATGTYTTV